MLVRRCTGSKRLLKQTRSLTTSKTFGLLVDIDGVLIRGSKTVPGTEAGFHKLSDGRGNLVRPVVFLTNGSYRSEAAKAEELTERLGVRISGSQIVLVNTPLRMFTEWHDKQVFFAGQGSSLPNVARDLGFKNPVTLPDVFRDIPMFDVVSHKKREALISGVLPAILPPYFPIEGVVISNTPENWDAHIQFLLDLLLTHGTLHTKELEQAQLPVIACNPDLVWASEYHMPRIACGAFVHMFASLYQEISGRELEVTWCGKPTEITYTYALRALERQAEERGLELGQVYGVGDNVDVDVVGANRNGVESVLVCSGLYENEDIDLERNMTVKSKLSSVTEPIHAAFAARDIARFIDYLIS